MTTCKSCGESFVHVVAKAARERYRDDRGEKLIEGELRYCRDCADEVYFNRLRTTPAKVFYPGPGSPGEPSDDASPGQENAIRELEG